MCLFLSPFLFCPVLSSVPPLLRHPPSPHPSKITPKNNTQNNSDIYTCIAFPAWMHNFTASLSPRLSQLSGFELVKLLLGFSTLGYKPSWAFLHEIAAAVEVRGDCSHSLHSLSLFLCHACHSLLLENSPAVTRAPPEITTHPLSCVCFESHTFCLPLTHFH